MIALWMAALLTGCRFGLTDYDSDVRVHVFVVPPSEDDDPDHVEFLLQLTELGRDCPRELDRDVEGSLDELPLVQTGIGGSYKVGGILVGQKYCEDIPTWRYDGPDFYLDDAGESVIALADGGTELAFRAEGLRARPALEWVSPDAATLEPATEVELAPDPPSHRWITDSVNDNDGKWALTQGDVRRELCPEDALEITCPPDRVAYFDEGRSVSLPIPDLCASGTWTLSEAARTVDLVCPPELTQEACTSDLVYFSAPYERAGAVLWGSSYPVEVAFPDGYDPPDCVSSLTYPTQDG